VPVTFAIREWILDERLAVFLAGIITRAGFIRLCIYVSRFDLLWHKKSPDPV